jgi:hypothetical protein
MRAELDGGRKSALTGSVVSCSYPVCVPLQAGDATFHNGLTAHTAGPNMTPRGRRGFVSIYMLDGSTYNGQRNVLPQHLYDGSAPDDRLDDDNLNPILHPRGQLIHGACRSHSRQVNIYFPRHA